MGSWVCTVNSGVNGGVDRGRTCSDVGWRVSKAASVDSVASGGNGEHLEGRGQATAWAAGGGVWTRRVRQRRVRKWCERGISEAASGDNVASREKGERLERRGNATAWSAGGGVSGAGGGRALTPLYYATLFYMLYYTGGPPCGTRPSGRRHKIEGGFILYIIIDSTIQYYTLLY